MTTNILVIILVYFSHSDLSANQKKEILNQLDNRISCCQVLMKAPNPKHIYQISH